MTEPMGKTLNEFLDNLIAVEEMDDSAKVWMFIQLVDEKTLLQELNLHALSLKVGMVPPSVIHDFVYGILRLAKPYLYDKVSKDDPSS